MINERLGRVKAKAEKARRPMRAPGERFTVHLDAAVVEALRNAAAHEGVTLRAITTEALEAGLLAICAERNGGKPFPQRTGRLKTGRPRGRAGHEEPLQNH